MTREFSLSLLLPGLPRWCSGKGYTLQRRRCKRHRFDSWVGKMPWKKETATHSLQYSCMENPGKQRSLAGHSPWGRKELDTPEHAHTLS